MKKVTRISEFWNLKEVADKLGYDWVELGQFGVFGYKKGEDKEEKA